MHGRDGDELSRSIQFALDGQRRSRTRVVHRLPSTATRCLEPPVGYGGNVVQRDVKWDVTRVGGIVRIDLREVNEVTQADTDAMIAATEELLAHDGVTVVRFNGPALTADDPPDGLRYTVRRLQALADQHGRELVIGPI